MDNLLRDNLRGTGGPVIPPEVGPPTICQKCGDQHGFFEQVQSVRIHYVIPMLIGQDVPPMLIPILQFKCRTCGELLHLEEIKRQYACYRDNGSKDKSGEKK